ncbi:MAG: hypothetical protein GYB66_04330 [Chloroflexi bacterium]|nr:hypothetical protein [Chloroflexota bacterium]
MNNIAWNEILPVIVSILIIIAIAILRRFSETFAAIVAVMPINIPLGMWIIYAAEADKTSALANFSEALLLNFFPTVLFMLVAWQMSRAGYQLVPIILAGYGVWAVGIMGVFWLRSQFGL